MGSELLQGARFVLTYETAVAGDVGDQNGRKPAFDRFRAQFLFLERRPGAKRSRLAPRPFGLRRSDNPIKIATERATRGMIELPWPRSSSPP